MSTAAGKPAVKTGNEILDREIPLLTEKQLAKLADYARFLIWLRDNRSNKDDTDKK